MASTPGGTIDLDISDVGTSPTVALPEGYKITTTAPSEGRFAAPTDPAHSAAPIGCGRAADGAGDRSAPRQPTSSISTSMRRRSDRAAYPGSSASTSQRTTTK